MATINQLTHWLTHTDPCMDIVVIRMTLIVRDTLFYIQTDEKFVKKGTSFQILNCCKCLGFFWISLNSVSSNLSFKKLQSSCIYDEDTFLNPPCPHDM